ncbi:uncharacterized protein LAESUDRAFT_753783 [Laetiporus sulphureus 93-53]|uniref:BHLH domain-containing protein n=1 Tax=Laetiporus sulphureus 93-53 TaxID=1314785 RepID=A0A165I8N0_9APHY|nr:uncharacterized protein LAESUDRAFT_753783 [Laetiporus sulphureus 93-53]KZT12735.1 hypothetical protein LAESUDRAFT_753783 [Laetiporus sulphureus 93-53]
MSEPRKRIPPRKAKNAKAMTQTSLRKLFAVKDASYKTDSLDLSTEVHGSEEDAETETSSQAEAAKLPPQPSSPVSTNAESVIGRNMENSKAEQGKSYTTINTTKMSLRPKQYHSLRSRMSKDSVSSVFEGTSLDTPIVLDSGPTEHFDDTGVTSRPVYPIFAARAGRAMSSPTVSVSDAPTSLVALSHKRKVDTVPYPEADTQHVRGPQSNFSAPPLRIGRRSPRLRPLSLEHSPPQLITVTLRRSNESTTRSLQSQSSILQIGSSMEMLPLRAFMNMDGDTRDAHSASHFTDVTALSDNSSSEEILNEIPLAHRTYPAIHRLLQNPHTRNLDPLSAPQELWTDKWRPRRADEVLGNEDRALYLRAWLLALRLHIDANPTGDTDARSADSGRGTRKKGRAQNISRGIKRPRILRQVDKRKRRRRLSSEEPETVWVTGGASETDCSEAESEDEFTFCQRTFACLQRASGEADDEVPSQLHVPTTELHADTIHDFTYSTPQLGDLVHNTILLSGPCGCGKTAAVYACADELGWDVFEVYPGIGERSGAALNKLIGEVGKNHLVKQTRRQQKAPYIGDDSTDTPEVIANNVRERNRTGRRGLKRVDSEMERASADGNQWNDSVDGSEVGTFSEHTCVSQSIILVEEVDILYASDANFWPALINIIKDCRRPVVLTCNDLALVPVNDLPLQEILTFAPCPAPLLTSYLQSISMVENRPLKRSVISRLLGNMDDHSCGDVEGEASHPFTRNSDLRSGLLSLQFGQIPRQIAIGSLGENRSDGDTDRKPGPLSFRQNSIRSGDKDGEGNEDLPIFRQLGQCEDVPSFVDCYLRRRFAAVLTESMAVTSHEADDELGYTILREDAFTADATLPMNQSYYHQDDLMVREALSEYENSLQSVCNLPADHQGCVSSARDYAKQIVAILRQLHIPEDVLMNNGATSLDYGPWVRYMVALDDANEATYAGSQAAREDSSTGIKLKAARVPSTPSSADSPLHTTMEPTGIPCSSTGGPAPNSGGTQNNAASPRIIGSRHSPVTPLAPLAYLQNQRRGSITDPSLHAGPTLHSHMTNTGAVATLPASLRHLNSPPGTGFSAPPTSHDTRSRGLPGLPGLPALVRPASPFRFGEASTQSSGSNSSQSSRRPLRSSSADASKRPGLSDGTRDSGGGPERSMSGPSEGITGGNTSATIHVRSSLASSGLFAESSRVKGTDNMDVDSQDRERERGASQHPQTSRESGEVEYSARRDSIATGTKRKISIEQRPRVPGPDSVDSLLIGPGTSGGENVAGGGPASKRRGSTFDTKIAQLSLYDRRTSVDARVGGGSSWWGAERREMSSTFASTPLGGYSTPGPAFADPPHGRPPGGIATFAWPQAATPQHPDQAAGDPMQNEATVNMAAPAHPYDPLAIMPPVPFPQDRRMSAPNIAPENLPAPPPSTGPTRVLRSRSRPPSRVRAADQSGANNLAGPSSVPPAGGAKSEDVSLQQTHHSLKEPGSTPYSRSPELRVSHKLAERKRRKEMKDLFDELRDQLPADRGMKASKWEILSKAIDFIVTLKQSHQDMSREIDMLRHELDNLRHGMPPPFPGGPQAVVYTHAPVGVPTYPHPVPPSGPPPQPHQAASQHQGPHSSHQPHSASAQPSLSRPGSSENVFPPGPPSGGQPSSASGGGGPGAPMPRTDTPS